MACFGETTDTSTQQQSATTQATGTAEEQELNRLRAEQAKELIPYETSAAKQGYGISEALLNGGEGLPAVFNKLFAGISPEITSDIAQQSIQDLIPGFQKSGILDSGVAASIAARTAGDIRRQSAEYNLTNLFNLLQTGLGYGGQQQQLTQSGTSSLANTLSGLRSTTSTGNMTSTATTNPFLKSFYSSAGQSLGKTLTGGRSVQFAGMGIGGT